MIKDKKSTTEQLLMEPFMPKLVTEEELDFDPLEKMGEPLLAWYDGHKRTLPWREDPSPYRVWISEIMLQQTRVEAGKAYFERFTKELPKISDLANVDDQKLMKLWEGLGYYNRARNLKKAAGVIVEKYSGRMPQSYEELLELPGIGPYTAGAVASIAFGIPVPAVDGNVLRVLSRLLLSWEDISAPAVRKKMDNLLLEVIPKDRPGDFNQAIMDLGATVCIPNGEPKCAVCPLSSFCKGHLTRRAAELPVKKSAKARKKVEKTVLILQQSGRMAVRKRADKGLLAGLWELPWYPEKLTEEAVRVRLEKDNLPVKELLSLGEAVHIFSHVEWHMTGYLVTLALFGGEDNLRIAEENENIYYSKDLEEKRAGIRQQTGRETESVLSERLVWINGRELSETYPLPTAFKGFAGAFPKE